MALSFHPPQGSVVAVNFAPGFTAPEMVKLRLAVVLSPAIERRQGLCTVVPLSTTPPEHPMPYHYSFTIPFKLPPRWGNIERWIKGDMVTTVGLHRVDLLSLGKNRAGQRIYQKQALDEATLNRIKRCVLHGLGYSVLTKSLKPSK